MLWLRDMAGAFLAGGSAALIAAFTAIARRGRRRFGTRKGRSKAEDGAGQLFYFAMQSRPSAASHRAQRDGQKLGAAAENGCPRAIANRIRAAAPCVDQKDQPPPGASGRSPLVKAAARLFPAGHSAPQRKPHLLLPGTGNGRMTAINAAHRDGAIGSGSVCGRTRPVDPPGTRACRRRRGGRDRG